MAKGFEGELLHFGSVRYRITGSGSFLSTLSSLDSTLSQTLPNITLSTSPGVEPTILSTYVSQRGYLQGQVTGIGDYFDISKIIVFINQFGEGLPL